MSYVALKRLNPNHPVVVTLEVLLQLLVAINLMMTCQFLNDSFIKNPNTSCCNVKCPMGFCKVVKCRLWASAELANLHNQSPQEFQNSCQSFFLPNQTFLHTMIWL